MSLPYSNREPVIKRGLVGAFAFNSGRGINDISGKGIAITPVNNPILARKGRFGFSGASYLGMGDAAAISITGVQTMSLWYNSNDSGTARALLSRYAASDFNRCYELYKSSGNNIVFTVSPDGANPTTSINTSAANYYGKWIHVVVQYDGSYLRMWVDGVAITPVAYSGGVWQTSAATHKIGYGGIGTYFSGEIAEICYYNVALTEAEIKAIYNAGVPEDDKNLVLHVTDGTEDLSVNKRTLTPFNTIIGKKMTFDGASGYIDAGADFIGTGDITITGWVNADSYGENSLGIIIDNGRFILRIYDAAGANSFNFSSNGSTFIRAAINAVTLNKWIHYVITRTSIGITNFYVNGELSGTANQSSGTPTAGSTNVYIGNRSTDDRTFDGKIDDVRIYSSIKSADWVKNYYNQSKGRY